MSMCRAQNPWGYLQCQGHSNILRYVSFVKYVNKPYCHCSLVKHFFNIKNKLNQANIIIWRLRKRIQCISSHLNKTCYTWCRCARHIFLEAQHRGMHLFWNSCYVNIEKVCVSNYFHKYRFTRHILEAWHGLFDQCGPFLIFIYRHISLFSVTKQGWGFSSHLVIPLVFRWQRREQISYNILITWPMFK